MLLSLDIRVDVTWWLEGASGKQVLNWLLLDEALPLSQASWLVEHFERERGMDQWNTGHWHAYIRRKVDEYEKLSGEQEVRREKAGLAGGAMMAAAERRAGTSGMAAAPSGAGVGGMPAVYPAEGWAQLERGAALLAERLRGRQLLAAEAEALLADTVPQLASWRAAAQLARLYGRLSITAALELATRRRPAWLSAHGAPRCRRCGSVARQRVPCAACGLAACAYCEACLALGRSRACALLLRSAAPVAVQGTAAPSTDGGLARWGLSAAQSAAASAALAYLSRPTSAKDGPGRFLLWAVTGAGKTEMVFPCDG
ncbi:hypothetical protein [Paenibacillus xylanilyticus]|uniref:Uncharacterized protein n=1 Tax=Paenibacillus xylanilyticus TaxID=248903 RepID=A0A7Y6EVP7_9BACL|nr:hypothetical protein [Paenibacillus xylanilyticus]NUU76946.1 hypothetical protein [Paenibacillus xylanilyticus]